MIEPGDYTIGAMLRDYRVRNGISLRDAAAACGVPPVAFGEWERGVSMPPEWLLRRCEQGLGFRFARELSPSPQVTLETVVGVDEAIDDWRCSCGPVALAAALGLTDVDALREAFDPFPGYTTITKVREAIARCGARVVRQWSKPDKRAILRGCDGARFVLMLQWSGPWNSVPRAAARHRHAIAYVRGYVGQAGPAWVGDINQIETWCPATWWADNVPKRLAPKRWDGEIIVTWAAQVEQSSTTR